MKKVKQYGYSILGGVVGFFIPYVFVGALSLMGSINYWKSINSNVFLFSVLCTTVFGVMLVASDDDGKNLRSH